MKTTEKDFLDVRYGDLPEGVEDRIVVEIVCNLDFRERLLLLFRPLSVTVLVDCEKKPGKTKAISHAWASRWRWFWEPNGGICYEAKAE